MTNHSTEHHDHHAAAVGARSGHGAAAEALAHSGVNDVAECPVMAGTMVIKAAAEAAGLVRTHQGEQYWLCCDACGPLFDADPDRYVD